MTEKLNNDLSVITIFLANCVKMALSKGTIFFQCFVYIQRLKSVKIRCNIFIFFKLVPIICMVAGGTVLP